jgi:hypothetical protein
MEILLLRSLFSFKKIFNFIYTKIIQWLKKWEVADITQYNMLPHGETSMSEMQKK